MRRIYDAGPRGPHDVSPHKLRSWLRSGDAVLIDCREAYEHSEESVAGAVLHPLSAFDADKLREDYPGRRVVFHCQSGNRSTDAATRFRREGEPGYQLSGGIEAWKAAGFPVDRALSTARIPVMRQVQVVAGGLVVVGVGLGAAVSPWFLGISAFVGCGLMFAGISGWCGMARLLAMMPWNRGLRRTSPTAGAHTAS